MTTPPRDGPLTFCEELVILLLNDGRGALAPLPRPRVECALAGAALMDLAFANRIDTALETLFVVDRTRTGNPLLDPVLARIAARVEPGDTLDWLRTLAAGDVVRIRDQALILLVRRGLVERRERSFNWAFAPHPDGTARRRRRGAGRRIERRVRDALLSDALPHPRDAALIGLVDTCDLLGEVIPEADIDRLRPRVAQLRRLDLIGRELARAVSDIERGVAATVAAVPPGPSPARAGAPPPA